MNWRIRQEGLKQKEAHTPECKAGRECPGRGFSRAGVKAEEEARSGGWAVEAGHHAVTVDLMLEMPTGGIGKVATTLHLTLIL